MESIGIRSIYIRHQEIIDLLMAHAPVFSEWFAKQNSSGTEIIRFDPTDLTNTILRYYVGPPGTSAYFPFPSRDNPWQRGALTWLSTEQEADFTISEWSPSARLVNIADANLKQEIIRSVNRIARVARKDAIKVRKIYAETGANMGNCWITAGADEFFRNGGLPSACTGPGPWQGYPAPMEYYLEGYLDDLRFFHKIHHEPRAPFESRKNFPKVVCS